LLLFFYIALMLLRWAD